jgi:hypothetical protein
VIVRRALFLLAAASTAAALALPLWGFRMSAPQYPGEALHLRITRTAIAGDVREVETLQKYIGVRFPTQLPELKWVAAAIGSLALLLALAGLLGEGKSGRACRRAVAGLLLLFLVASAVLLQKRLYDVGHERDPHAPIQAVCDFTPPAVGPVHVGNFTVWSYPHAGGLALALAGVLSLLGARKASRVEPACGCAPAQAGAA